MATLRREWALVSMAVVLGCTVEPRGGEVEDHFREFGVTILAPTADTFVDGSASYANSNYGSYTTAMLSGATSKTLVQFPVDEAVQATQGGELVSATLRFHLLSVSDMGAGQTVLLHRLVQPWQEAMVTHNCSADTSLANDSPDCQPFEAWHLSSTGGDPNPWVAGIATAYLTDENTVLEFDVTEEVAGIVSGVATHHGWLLELVDSSTGLVRIQTRESEMAPELVLTVDDTPSTTTDDWDPPDPEQTAPEPNLTAIIEPAGRMTFLSQGPDPVQIDVQPEAIDPAKVGVVRGRVLARSGVPLSGVEVRIAHHPELGKTESRADGFFDITANGGGQYTLTFEKDDLNSWRSVMSR